MNTKRYAEELEVGETFEFGDFLFTEENIIAFSTQYDPQLFHTDPVAAKETPLGVFCASAVQLLAVVQQLNVKHVYDKVHIIAGRSIDKLRLLQPTVPGDCIRVQFTITGIKLYRGQQRGLVSAECKVLKQGGSLGARMQVEILVAMAGNNP